MRLSLPAALLCVAFAPFAIAQATGDVPFEPPETFDPAQFDAAHGKEVFQTRARCLECHGWDGAGTGRNPRAPAGPNLRETTLDAALIHEVVACGRPGTEMPYHSRDAYKDGRCYGLTATDFEEGEEPNPGYPIRAEEIDDLVAYVATEIVGAGDTTLAQCEAFFRPGHRNCRGLSN